MNAVLEVSPLLSPFWPATRRVLIAAFQERRNARYMWVTWAMLAMAVVVGIAVAFILPGTSHTALRIRISLGAMGFILVGLGLMWWSLILHSVLAQHSSFEASLVPAMARRIRASTALLGVSLTLSMALIGAGIGMNFFMTWSASIVVLSVIAWLFVQPMWMILIAWGGSFLFYSDPVRSSDVALMLLEHDPLAVGLLVAVCLCLAVATYQTVFSESPERREKMRKRIAVIKKMYAMDGSAQTAWSAYAWNGWTMKAPWGYTARLQAMLARHAPTNRLVPMMFGPSLHWSMIFNMTLAYAVLMLVGRLVLAKFSSGSEAVHGFLGSSIIFSILLPIVMASSVRPAYWQSRGEQAVLILTPKMPQGQALNRLVARFLLSRMALAYLAGMLLLVMGDQFSPLFPGHRDQVFLAMLAVPAPMIPMVLFQAGRMRKPGPLAIFGMMILAYFTCGVVVVEELAAHLLPTGGVDAIIVILSLLVAAVRYRSMVNGPCQFPVGRLDTRGA